MGPSFGQRGVDRARRDGQAHPLRWPTTSMGPPTKQVELPVRGGGRILGTFILTPTPATPISQERCVVAVALADQLGTALSVRRGSH